MPLGAKSKSIYVIAILFLFCIALYALFHSLISRYYFCQAFNYCYDRKIGETKAEKLDRAEQLLKKSEYWYPDFAECLFRADMQKIYAIFGKIHYLRTAHVKTMKDYHSQMSQAEKYYRKAMKLNPYDTVAALGLARAIAGLELSHAKLHPDADKTLYDAVPAFESALRLRPNGVAHHYAFIKYLAFTGRTQKLELILKNLTRVYPRIHAQLKKEHFYNASTRDAIKNGLLAAAEEKIQPRDAHLALASISIEEKLPEKAVDHYKTAMSYQPSQNNVDNHIRLGELYLTILDFANSEKQFMMALRIAVDQEKESTRIYNIYKQQKHHGAFIEFVNKVEKEISTSRLMNIYKAEALLAEERFEDAKDILKKLNKNFPDAEMHFRLALIAEKQQDWDEMELSSHDAIILDKSEPRYRALFVSSLKKQQKIPQAEAALTDAIEYLNQPTAGLFNDRAWLRYRMQIFDNAIEDWKKAIELEPTKSAYYHNIAMALDRQEHYHQALIYVEQALKINPSDPKHQELLRQLKSKISG